MNECTKLKDYVKSVSMFFKSLETPYNPGKKEIDTFLHILTGVKDFRIKGKTVYKLENILAICFYLALKGEFTSFLYAEKYVRVKEDEFVALGLIKKGQIPSHDTFLYIFNRLDASSLRDVFIEKFKKFLETIYILIEDKDNKLVLISGDGKTFNGSGRKEGRKQKKKRNLNVFNIYSASSSICSNSIPLDDKDSEIKTFEEYLKKYDLRKTMVTADALHCQRKICSTIIKKKGQYVLKAKDNQETLVNEIAQSFEKYPKKIKKLSFNSCDYELLLIKDIISDTDWPGCKSYIKMISHKREDQSDYNPIPQYFVSSSPDIQLIAEAVDNRWDIEDGLHYFKDKFLDEDACTFMGKNAVKVMATINNIVYAFYRIASAIVGDETMSMTIIRYKDNPVELISLVAPLLKKTNLNKLIRMNMRGVKEA